MLPVGSHVAEARGLAHYRWHSFHYSGWHSLWHAGRGHSRFARWYGGSGRHHGYARYSHGYAHYYGGGIQCVAFVREETGVQLSGNAAGWWRAADGLYDRGNKPEPGAVLVFRGAGRMRLGHVAVVRNLLSPRHIEIDHAHWAGSGIYRNVSVIDVSRDNDWTDVRVAIRPGGEYGSVYPTYGFIYDHTRGPRIETAKATDAPPATVQPASATVQPATATVQQVRVTVQPLNATVQPASAIVQPASAMVQPVSAIVQPASATVQQATATVQQVSATELQDAVDTEDAPRTGLRRHARRHWHRQVARRHVIAEVAEQPAHTH
jgi:surface antigen